MAEDEDDDFNNLCSFFEKVKDGEAKPAGTSNSSVAQASAVAKNPDPVDVRSMIDSFLEESADIRQAMFTEPELVPSESKAAWKRAIRRGSEEDGQPMWDFEDPAGEPGHSEDSRAIASAHQLGGGKVSSRSAEVIKNGGQSSASVGGTSHVPAGGTSRAAANGTSQVLVANLDLDYGLLDQEDWEDDEYDEEEEEYVACSLEDLLNDPRTLALLESDSEEDEDDVDAEGTEELLLTRPASPSDETAGGALAQEASGKGTSVKQASAKEARPEKPAKRKITLDDLKRIDRMYYEVLQYVYNKYRDEPGILQIPPAKQARAWVYKDRKDPNSIIGFESLEEYVDNKHPLWSILKLKFQDFLQHQQGPLPHALLAAEARQQWRSGLRLDLNRNLTRFPRHRAARPGCRPNSLSSAGRQKKAADAKEKLIEMYERVGAEAVFVKRQEDERYQLYLNRKAHPQQGVPARQEDPELAECEYCLKFCLCSPGRFLRGPSRKRKSGGAAGCAPEDKRRRMDDDVERRVDLFLAMVGSQDVNRCVNIVKSYEEATNLNALYEKEKEEEEAISDDMIRELASMEKIHDDFRRYYKSPYASTADVANAAAKAVAAAKTSAATAKATAAAEAAAAPETAAAADADDAAGGETPPSDTEFNFVQDY